jgi:long-subunit acyl-CoA synthetase (AMP-forming)
MPSIQVCRVVFTDIVFSRENGFLRPNLKLDRKKIARHFQSQAAPKLVPATRSA